MNLENLIGMVFKDDFGDKVSLINRIPMKILWEKMFPDIDPRRLARQLDNHDRSLFEDMIKKALSEVNISRFMSDLPIFGDDKLCIDEIAVKLLDHLNDEELDNYVKPVFIDRDNALLRNTIDRSVGFTKYFRNYCSLFDSSESSWRIELRFPSYAEWLSEVLAAVDSAYDAVVSGRALDPSLFLLETERLVASAPYSSRDTRVRFCDAMIKTEQDGRDGRDGFVGSYYRRSAAMSLLEDVRRAIFSIEGGRYGTDEAGWPIWWSGNFAREEDIELAIGRYAAGAAETVVVGVPNGVS